MGYPETFRGFYVQNKEKWSTFKEQDIKPKKFDDYDIDIKIHFCGVCGSDLHVIQSGWEEANYPVCPGHEIVGEAVKVGSKVTTVKKGDIVGVGAQIWSCGECKMCKSDNENYCPKQVDTYNAKYPDGTVTQGGYSNYIRATERFVFNIPKGLPGQIAAPMLCGGLTVYSPLKRFGAGPGTSVAVVGLGGLGHFAVLFAAALGADVSVISHSSRKADDAKQLGAKNFILTDKKGWADKYAYEFDLVISTRDSAGKDYPLADYLSVLNVNGHFISVGLPDEPFPEVKPFMFASNGSCMGTTHIGSKKEVQEMLELAASKNIKSWITEIPISADGCQKAVESLDRGDERYRFVLTHNDQYFKT